MTKRHGEYPTGRKLYRRKNTQLNEAKVLLALEQNDDIWMTTAETALEAKLNQSSVRKLLNLIELAGKVKRRKESNNNMWRRHYID